jgi:hypothetical protein
MIADHTPTVTNVDGPVEVIQTEEAREVKPAPPERVWNPCVKVIIIPRRWVVGYDWRTFFIIIIVNYRWVRVALWLGLCVLALGTRN